MRTYEQTHPWLKFELDLRRAPPSLWMALGEAQSKCHHIAGVPLLPELAESLHNIFLAKGALATTAIEGNTLSEEQVRKRIAGTLKLPPSKEYLGIEIDNVVAALNGVLKDMLSQEPTDLSAAELKGFNRTILKRDLNALVAMELVEQVKGGYRARRGVILQFLPRSGRSLPLVRDDPDATS